MIGSAGTKCLNAIFLASNSLKKSAYLLSALLIVACQPSLPTSEPVMAENSEAFNTPLLIRADSITMTRDHILSVKPTRYQPSLGLEGHIEPIKKVNLLAVQDLTVEQVLVKKNQWVEKGAPLFTVRHPATSITPTSASQQPTNEAASTNPKPTIEVNNNADINSKQTAIDKAKTSANDSVMDNMQAEVKIAANNNKTNPQTNDIASNDTPNNTQVLKKSEQSYSLITVRASFSGRVEKLYIKNEQKIEARLPLLKLSDETELHFIATLPIEAESQISVGQTVNFTAEGLIDEFTGQVSKLTATAQPKQLLVYVNVVDNEVSRHQIRPDMKVTGRVDYGQIEVGTIVPKRALHDVDLTVLHKPPYKPLRPLIANVWIIKQDQRLTRQPVEVIEYDPLTEQYLIAGITNDSLICLANLPVESEGKKAVVS